MKPKGVLMSNDKFHVVKRQLNLFQDPQGRWHCEGRIHNANLPYSTRFPVFLPNHHHFTRLVVLCAHERVFHNGVKETLTEIRSQYWITNGRAGVQKLIHAWLHYLSETRGIGLHGSTATTASTLQSQ